MTHLDNLIQYFRSGDDEALSEYNNIVRKDLQNTRQTFEQDNIILDIEPVGVTETKEETDDHTIVRQSGTYIYGFQKNGVFHEIPGDLTSKKERGQNETGEIVFYINKHTEKVDAITESFAGNTWGEKPQKNGLLKKLSTLFKK